MQYRETREQSAEILRIVLTLMARQQAAFHPASYALWYEHAAGINPSLSQVLEQRIATNTALTDGEVLRLHAQYTVTRDVEAIERIQQRLLALLRDASQIVSDTGTHAVEFGETLEGHTARLKLPVPLELISEIVNELLTEAQQMCSASVTLSRQLDTSAQEVLTLTHRLEQVQAEALRDPLTGLLNRRGFESAVADLHAHASYLAGTSVLLVDVDYFKRINDTHGHLVGDQVLRAVAQVLRARIKGADIAARVGGDEFAVLLPGTAMSGALALAEQIRTTVPQGRLRRIDQQQDIEDVTLSVGVAHGGAGDRLDDLMHRADAELYAAKRSGRNRVSPEGAAESDARDNESDSSQKGT
jgi:diguanylate cyclase